MSKIENKNAYSIFWKNFEYIKSCEEMQTGQFERFLGVSVGTFSRLKKEMNLEKYGYVLEKLSDKYDYPVDAFFNRKIDKRKFEINYRTRRFLIELKEDTKEGMCLWRSEGKFNSEFGDYGDLVAIQEKLQEKKIDCKKTEMWSAEESRTRKILYIAKTAERFNLFLKIDDGVCEICDSANKEEYYELLKEIYHLISLYCNDLLPDEEKAYQYMGAFLSSVRKF